MMRRACAWYLLQKTRNTQTSWVIPGEARATSPFSWGAVLQNIVRIGFFRAEFLTRTRQILKRIDSDWSLSEHSCIAKTYYIVGMLWQVGFLAVPPLISCRSLHTCEITASQRLFGLMLCFCSRWRLLHEAAKHQCDHMGDSWRSISSVDAFPGSNVSPLVREELLIHDAFAQRPHKPRKIQVRSRSESRFWGCPESMSEVNKFFYF